MYGCHCRHRHQPQDRMYWPTTSKTSIGQRPQPLLDAVGPLKGCIQLPHPNPPNRSIRGKGSLPYMDGISVDVYEVGFSRKLMVLRLALSLESSRCLLRRTAQCFVFDNGVTD